MAAWPMSYINDLKMIQQEIPNQSEFFPNQSEFFVESHYITRNEVRIKSISPNLLNLNHIFIYRILIGLSLLYFSFVFSNFSFSADNFYKF